MASRAVRYLIRSVVGVVVVAGLATIGLWSWHAKVLQAPGPHSNDVFVVVESGDGHATIRWHLKRAGVITELFHYDLAKFLAGDSYLP
ncbi:MAG: ABC transporter substrate-binding protein, partial [Candidatus Puniceispirillaceae bacterium]